MVAALNALLSKHPRWGFRLCYDRLRLDGHEWNHKRVRRVYRELGLNPEVVRGSRLPARRRAPLDASAEVNQGWALDFMSDSLAGGRRFRTLNILDEGVREALRVVIDTAIPSGRVVRTLEEVAAWRGYPKALREDHGPELISANLAQWCEERGVQLRFIEPGKPSQNAYIERFNRTYRHEVLDAYVFTNLDQAREITEDWLKCYNEERPHRSLGRVTPTMFRERIEQPETRL